MGQRVRLTENMLRGMVRKAISEELMRLDEAKHNYSRDARKVIYDWLVENGRIKPFDNGISDADKNEKIKALYKIRNIEQKFLDSFMHGYSNYKDPLKRLEPIFLKIALENGWWSHSPSMEVVRGLRMILNYLIECYNKSGGGDVIIWSDVDEKGNSIKNYYLRDIQPGITYEQLKNLCSNAFSNNDNNSKIDVNKAKTEEYKTDTGYTIIPNVNFLQAHDIGKWSGGLGSTRLCYTGSKGVWDQYTNSSENTVYVLLKDGYKEMQPEEYADHEDRPYDPYGESMIFLFVDPNGNLKYSNVRWNHCFQELGGNKTDHNYTKEGIEKLTGLSFDNNFVNVGNEENEKYLVKVENILAGREKNVNEVEFTIQKFNVKKGLYIITVSSGQANVFDENSGQMLYSKWFDSTNCYYQENNLLYYRVFVGQHQNIIRPNGDLLFDGPPSEWPKEVSRCDNQGFLIFTTDDDKENYIHLNEGYILYEPNNPDNWFKRCFSFTRKGWAKAVFFNGLYNIIDTNGNVAYEPENPDMWFSVCDYPNENGITKVAYNNGKFTFLDVKKGVIIYKPNDPDNWFERAVRQLENILIVKDSKQYYLLTAEGAIVTLNGDGFKYLHENGIELHRIFTTVEQYEGSNLVYIEFDGHCNLLKDKTTILLPIWPTDIFFYSQGVARAKFGPTKWNFIDANGNIMYEPNNPQNWFNHTTPFDENGISIVEFDGAENYFRTNGTFLFPNTWLDHCNSFQDGLARIRLNGKYNYIDVNGNILFPNTWFKFCSHYFNEKGLAMAQLDSGNYLIDKKGNFYDPYTQQQVNPPAGENIATNEAIVKLKNKINNFVNEAIVRYYSKYE